MEILGPQLDELGIQYERHSAVDGKERGISPITAGTMSHVEVLKNHRDQKILVLEDDAYFVKDFNEQFEAVTKTLPNDSDIFYLGALLPKHTGKVTPVNDNWSRQVMTTGSHSYCINPARVNYFIEGKVNALGVFGRVLEPACFGAAPAPGKREHNVGIF